MDHALAITITITVYNHIIYDIVLVGAGCKKLPLNVKIIAMQFTRVLTTVPMLLYGGSWCVKLTFLIFFRRLGLRGVTSLRR
jgi:hypothetical protein